MADLHDNAEFDDSEVLERSQKNGRMLMAFLVSPWNIQFPVDICAAAHWPLRAIAIIRLDRNEWKLLLSRRAEA